MVFRRQTWASNITTDLKGKEIWVHEFLIQQGDREKVK